MKTIHSSERTAYEPIWFADDCKKLQHTEKKNIPRRANIPYNAG